MSGNVLRLTPQNFELFSGADKYLNVTVRDKNNQVVDLTGATITWALSRTPKSTKLVEYTSPVDIIILDPATEGKFQVQIKNADTEALKGGTRAKPEMYYHEARVQSAAGLRTPVMYGDVELLNNLIE